MVMTSNANLIRAFVAIATAFVCTAAAAAQVDPAIKACATLRNDPERLACYDRTVAQLSGDADAKPLTPQDLFGIEAASSTASTAAPAREEIPSITAQVSQLRQASDGSLVIELDNGQVWKQEDSKSLLLKIGDAVTITRAALKSFKLSAPGSRFARVRRLR